LPLNKHNKYHSFPTPSTLMATCLARSTSIDPLNLVERLNHLAQQRAPGWVTLDLKFSLVVAVVVAVTVAVAA
jgi:hypothetical protein